MSRRMTPIRDRFETKYVPDPTTGCWLWTGATNGFGYGRINRGRVAEGNAPAHAVAYSLYVGPIPEGLVIDHLCRTPLCVNPRHLEPVTNRENVLRGLKGRMVTHCPRGHEHNAENTMIDHGRRRCRACTRRGNSPASRTHCPQGHPYDEVNTGRDTYGWRFCRICRNDSARRYRERQRV